MKTCSFVDAALPVAKYIYDDDDDDEMGRSI